MIESIEIARLRGIREGKLERLTPLTILVGPNGCGKSTVLDALLIAGSPDTSVALGRVGRRRASLAGGEVRWLFWQEWEGKHARVTIKVGNQTRDIILSHVGDSLVAANPVTDRGSQVRRETIVQFVRPDKQVSGDFSWYSVSKNEIPPLESVPEVSLIEPYPTARIDPIEDVYSQAIKRGRRQEVLSLLQDVLPGLRALESLKDNRETLLHAVYDSGAVPVAAAGDGVRLLVRLSLDLAVCAGGLVLLEEPEIHQHIRLITQTAKAIWAAVRRGVQVVISTHSLELIDALVDGIPDAELEKNLSLYRLSLRDGKLDSARMSGDSVAVGRKEIGDDLR